MSSLSQRIIASVFMLFSTLLFACYVAIISKSLKFGNCLCLAKKSALSGEACLKAIISKLTFFGNCLEVYKAKAPGNVTSWSYCRQRPASRIWFRVDLLRLYYLLELNQPLTALPPCDLTASRKWTQPPQCSS